ncbi:hypothetical protein C8P69_1052 [Phreatobacter oligotrophus]|uniref:Uncharacterized protein n=1 Tax=Phreatobacter oligotrophus TaxID=1122261 RepID=A0A2T4Z251_9HYPH|nr:hypothetical protein C8P69_1052 [Phreatobacter oligotrophus]
MRPRRRLLARPRRNALDAPFCDVHLPRAGHVETLQPSQGDLVAHPGAGSPQGARSLGNGQGLGSKVIGRGQGSLLCGSRNAAAVRRAKLGLLRRPQSRDYQARKVRDCGVDRVEHLVERLASADRFEQWQARQSGEVRRSLRFIVNPIDHPVSSCPARNDPGKKVRLKQSSRANALFDKAGFGLFCSTVDVVAGQARVAIFDIIAFGYRPAVLRCVPIQMLRRLVAGTMLPSGAEVHYAVGGYVAGGSVARERLQASPLSSKQFDLRFNCGFDPCRAGALDRYRSSGVAELLHGRCAQVGFDVALGSRQPRLHLIFGRRGLGAFGPGRSSEGKRRKASLIFEGRDMKRGSA